MVHSGILVVVHSFLYLETGCTYNQLRQFVAIPRRNGYVGLRVFHFAIWRCHFPDVSTESLQRQRRPLASDSL